MRCLRPNMSLRMGWPSKRISQAVVSMSPVIIFMVVDLPDPFGPKYPVISPARAWKLTLSTAGMPLKRLETLRSSSVMIAVRRRLPERDGCRKETAPGTVQREPLRSPRIAVRHFRGMQQPVSARARRLGAVPFQERLRRSADANRVAEQAKADGAAAALVRENPAQGQYPRPANCERPE